MYISNSDHSHLRRAQIIAEQSSMKQRHGAVIASGRRIFSVAVNTYRTRAENVSDPRMNASFHAEQNALRQLSGRDLSKMTMYVVRLDGYRERGTGAPKISQTTMSLPCERCQRMISESGIRRVVFSNYVGVGGYIE